MMTAFGLFFGLIHGHTVMQKFLRIHLQKWQTDMCPVECEDPRSRQLSCSLNKFLGQLCANLLLLCLDQIMSWILLVGDVERLLQQHISFTMLEVGIPSTTFNIIMAENVFYIYQKQK